MASDQQRWAKEGALGVARAIEMSRRRSELEAVRVPDSIDLLPAPVFYDSDSGRRELTPAAPLVLIGRYFRRSRAYAGLPQTQLAAKANVSQSMVSRVERARSPAMALERFVDMCLVMGRLFPLGVCPHDHRCGWQPVKPPAPGPDPDTFLDQLLRYAGET